MQFTFDDGVVYDGFAHGSTWNSFDNVAVTRETLDKIILEVMDERLHRALPGMKNKSPTSAPPWRAWLACVIFPARRARPARAMARANPRECMTYTIARRIFPTACGRHKRGNMTGEQLAELRARLRADPQFREVPKSGGAVVIVGMQIDQHRQSRHDDDEKNKK
jgi:hypothetical protein